MDHGGVNEGDDGAGYAGLFGGNELL